MKDLLKKILPALFCLVMFTITSTNAQVHIAIVKGDYLTVTPESYVLYSQDNDSAGPGERIDSLLGIFYIDYFPPYDFGYLQVECGLTGDTLWRASQVWAGYGEQEIPTEDDFTTGIEYGYPITDPDTFHFYLDDYRDMDDSSNAIAFWDSIKTSYPIHEIAKHESYEVLIINHFYTVGTSNPYTAEWIAIAVTKPCSFIQDATPLKKRYGLHAYPNPFRNSIAIQLNGLNTMEFKGLFNRNVQIFDLTGKLVKEYGFSPDMSGYLLWDGTDGNGRVCPSGTYILKLDNNKNTCYKIKHIK